MMSAPVIFSSVRGVLAQNFVDKIPRHVNKADFLERTCKEVNVTLGTNNSNGMLAIEGHLNDLLIVEELFQKHLQDWYLTNQCPELGFERNDSFADCPLSEPDRINKSVSKSFEACSTSNSQSKLKSNQQKSCRMKESQKICSAIIIPEESPRIELESHICRSVDPCSVDDVCLDKSSLEDGNEIYMDIQLSCRPEREIFKETGNAPVRVVLGTEKSLLETVCLESNKSKELSQKPVPLVENHCTSTSDWKKSRSQKYEEKALFKYFCSQCSFKSKRQSHLKKHSRLHESVCKLYSCDHCDFSTIRLGHLRRHALQHSELQLKCSSCGFKTHTKSLLQKHQNLKHKVNKLLAAEEKTVLQCLECNYSTTKEKFYQRHQIVHVRNQNIRKGKQKYFECSKCSFKTTVKSNLARHCKNIHMNDRPFLCKTCGQGFKRSDTLTQHLVVHASSYLSMNDLQCPHCQKFYRSKAVLQEHMLGHLDIRSYLCEICGAAFKTRAVHRKHMRSVHSSSKVYSCTCCSKEFNSQYAVKRHMKLHQQKPEIEGSPKSTLEPAQSTIQVPVADEWDSSVMTLPIHQDVQVFVVQQDNAEHGVMLNEGEIFVQDSTEEHTGTSDPSKTVNVPVFPVEYVLSDEVAPQGITASDLGDDFTVQDGQVITLQFVH